MSVENPKGGPENTNRPRAGNGIKEALAEAGIIGSAKEDPQRISEENKATKSSEVTLADSSEEKREDTKEDISDMGISQSDVRSLLEQNMTLQAIRIELFDRYARANPKYKKGDLEKIERFILSEHKKLSPKKESKPPKPKREEKKKGEVSAGDGREKKKEDQVEKGSEAEAKYLLATLISLGDPEKIAKKYTPDEARERVAKLERIKTELSSVTNVGELENFLNNFTDGFDSFGDKIDGQTLARSLVEMNDLIEEIKSETDENDPKRKQRVNDVAEIARRYFSKNYGLRNKFDEIFGYDREVEGEVRSNEKDNVEETPQLESSLEKTLEDTIGNLSEDYRDLLSKSGIIIGSNGRVRIKVPDAKAPGIYVSAEKEKVVRDIIEKISKSGEGYLAEARRRMFEMFGTTPKEDEGEAKVSTESSEEPSLEESVVELEKYFNENYGDLNLLPEDRRKELLGYGIEALKMGRTLKEAESAIEEAALKMTSEDNMEEGGGDKEESEFGVGDVVRRKDEPDSRGEEVVEIKEHNGEKWVRLASGSYRPSELMPVSDSEPDSYEANKMEEFRERFPEKYERVMKLTNPDLSREEFDHIIDEINEEGRQDAPKDGMYNILHLPVFVPNVRGQEVLVKYFENGRVTISVAYEDTGVREGVEEDDRELEDITGEGLDGARNLYLKALRLRGNVFRGALGRFFRRTLNFNGEELDFGGPLDLDKVRYHYEDLLKEAREKDIKQFAERLLGEGLTQEEVQARMTERVIALMVKEQEEIDAQAVEGIERGMFEKLKTKFRQMSKTRILGGFGLAAVAASGGALGVVAGGARAVLGGVGMYTGVEAGIQQHSKRLGHKGLVDSIVKKFGNDDVATREYVEDLDIQEVRREVARLRMLQVEKGVDIARAGRLGGKSAGAVAILLDRERRHTAEEVARLPLNLSPEEKLGEVISRNLSNEEGVRNLIWADETDREHVKKLGRKLTAVIAGGATGWLIGSKYFSGGDDAGAGAQPEWEPDPNKVGEVESGLGLGEADPEFIVPGEIPSPPDLSIEVGSGDSLWNILENKLSNDGFLQGLNDEQTTYVVDKMKDIFGDMDPAELQNVGISSGDMDLLNVGEAVDLSPALGDANFVAQAINEARNLSTEALQLIKENNGFIREWLSNHPNEFLSSEKVADILAGKA